MNSEEDIQGTAGRERADAFLVTVITPTYNQARYIAACIESVLTQTHQNIEYLIYDACSPDGTDKVIARHLQDLRVTYRREPDTGQASAINKGLEVAKGDIVCWLNSDDFFFDRETLEKVCRIFAADDKIDIVTGDAYFAGEDGMLLEPAAIAPDPALVSPAGLAIADYFIQPATFWRRNDVRLDETLHFALDWKFFLTMCRSGRSVFYYRNYLAVYRLQGEGKTGQDNAARRREIYQVLKFAEAGRTQIAWAWLIYALYALSETLHFPPIKLFAWLANKIMHRISRGRIFSC